MKAYLHTREAFIGIVGSSINEARDEEANDQYEVRPPIVDVGVQIILDFSWERFFLFLQDVIMSSVSTRSWK